MTFLEIIIFFLVVWWPIFFLILPIGYEQLSQDEQVKFAKTYPKNPRLFSKFLFTTILAFVITITFWFLSFYNIFSLKNLII